MKNKTDLELVTLVKEEADNEAILEICRRYENIFYKICQRYYGPLKASGLFLQDIFDQKYYIIFHCVISLDVTKKAKLSTWIGNYARYLCLNSIHEKRYIVPSTSDDIISEIESNQTKNNYLNNEITATENVSYLTDLLSKFKDQRITEVFKLRYCGDKKMTWLKIAENMKMSTQTVINLHGKGLNLLKKKFNSKTISDIV